MNLDPSLRPGACAVYIAQQGFNGPFKVGIGVNPNLRLQNLQVGNPAGIAMVHCEWFTNERAAQAEESTIHRALEEWSIRGEWFQSIPECVDALESIAPWATGKVRMGHEEIDQEQAITKKAIEIAARMIPEAVKEAMKDAGEIG